MLIPEASWLAPGGHSAILLITHNSPLPDSPPPPRCYFYCLGSLTYRRGHSHYQGSSAWLRFGATQVLLLSLSLFSTFTVLLGTQVPPQDQDQDQWKI